MNENKKRKKYDVLVFDKNNVFTKFIQEHLGKDSPEDLLR
jgi:hypothetical protein